MATDIDLQAAIATGQAHVCTTADVDECPHEREPMTARAAVMDIWGQVKFGQGLVFWWRSRNPETLKPEPGGLSLDNLRCLLMYAAETPSRRKRKPIVDVDAMVEKWIPIIRGLATAHDKADVDRCEFDSEDHLLPLTAAPVKQLREFYAKLCDRLEADPTIPFFIWSAFRVWGNVVLEKAPDGDVKQLRGDLAKRVADLVEADIRPDLNAALVGALQWRSPEDLKRVAAAVEGGAKPRMRGRESCLFLEVEEPGGGQTVTVML